MSGALRVRQAEKLVEANLLPASGGSHDACRTDWQSGNTAWRIEAASPIANPSYGWGAAGRT